MTSAGNGKSAFLFYADWYEMLLALDLADRGRLITALAQYAFGLEVVEEPPVAAKLAFIGMMRTLDRDAEKWTAVRAKRSEAGKRGGRPRKQPEQLEEGAVVEEVAEKQMLFPESKKSKCFFPKAKKAVNVNGNVDVNVNDNVNVNVNDKPLKPTPAKTAGAEDVTPYSKIMSRWNEICTSCGRIQGINGERRKLTRARWKEHPDLGWWSEFFAEIEQSDFLTGRTENGKWKVSYDWVIKPNNCDKIIEGRYKNRVIATPLTDRATTDYDF